MLFKKKPLYFGCNQCGECCKSEFAPLNHYDIHRLSAVRPLEEFIYLFPSQENTPHSLLLFGAFYKLYLKKKKGQCIFLKENACNIYAHRPSACQIWPFEPGETHLKIAVSKELFVSLACDQTPFKEYKTMKKSILQNDREYQAYPPFLETWNSEVKNRKDLQTFQYLQAFIQSYLN